MEQLDLIVGRSRDSDDVQEIEHWCPVCDRLLQPITKTITPTGLSALSTDNAIDASSPSQKASAPSTPITPLQPPTPTIHSKRKSFHGHRGGNIRPSLHRSRTSTSGTASGKKKAAAAAAADQFNRSNPNLNGQLLGGILEAPSLHQDDDQDQSAGGSGAAPPSKTSPMGNTSHSELHEEAIAQLGRAKGDSDLAPVDPATRRDGAPPSGAMKRKASAPDVNALLRLKPLTKAKLGGKPRPKSLNLAHAQLLISTDLSTPKASEPTTAVDPKSPSAQPMHLVEDLRRRLYCSQECYEVDLRGERFDIYRSSSPSTDDSLAPYTPPTEARTLVKVDKRNLSCEMPWLWTQRMDRRLVPTRNSSWMQEREAEAGEDSDDALIYMSPPPKKTGPIGVLPPKPLRERKMSKPLSPHEVAALRKMTPVFSGESSGDVVPAQTPSVVQKEFPIEGRAIHALPRTASARELPIGAPMRKARTPFEDEKEEHRLFFRRMPGKVDLVPDNMPPRFFVNGHWTETPPSNFDYAGFLKQQEKERRQKQIEATRSMLFKDTESTSPTGLPDLRSRHEKQERRKRKVLAEKDIVERRIRLIHGDAYLHGLCGSGHQEGDTSWWRVDEREDWNSYWEAKLDGLRDISFEEWQTKRHAERVERADRDQQARHADEERRRIHADLWRSTGGGDAKKLAKRPMLIRMASQPTIRDVDLAKKLFEEGEKEQQRRKRRSTNPVVPNASSSDTSPLAMNKALPTMQHSIGAREERAEQPAVSPSFLRGKTFCVSGFVVDEKDIMVEEPEDQATGSSFVYPLVAVPGTVEEQSTISSRILSPRYPPGLTFPAEEVVAPLPNLAKPSSPKQSGIKATIPPLDLNQSSAAGSDILPLQTAQPQKRVPKPSLASHLPDSSTILEANATTAKRTSLILPKSPLALHSFSAADLPADGRSKPPSVGRGRREANLSSRSRVSTSTSRSRPDEPPVGSCSRVLPPLVNKELASASVSPTKTSSTSGAEQITTGSGSGSSGEESGWSRAERRLRWLADANVAATLTIPRFHRESAARNGTTTRPRSMGAERVMQTASTKATPSESVVDGPLSYSASLLRMLSNFKGGSIPNEAMST